MRDGWCKLKGGIRSSPTWVECSLGASVRSRLGIVLEICHERSAETSPSVVRAPRGAASGVPENIIEHVQLVADPCNDALCTMELVRKIYVVNSDWVAQLPPYEDLSNAPANEVV